jgi:hypothetical protein
VRVKRNSPAARAVNQFQGQNAAAFIATQERARLVALQKDGVRLNRRNAAALQVRSEPPVCRETLRGYTGDTQDRLGQKVMNLRN